MRILGDFSVGLGPGDDHDARSSSLFAGGNEAGHSWRHEEEEEEAE